MRGPTHRRHAASSCCVYSRRSDAGCERLAALTGALVSALLHSNLKLVRGCHGAKCAAAARRTRCFCRSRHLLHCALGTTCFALLWSVEQLLAPAVEVPISFVRIIVNRVATLQPFARITRHAAQRAPNCRLAAS